MIWYGMVWYGMVWCGMVLCGMVWYGAVRCDIINDFLYPRTAGNTVGGWEVFSYHYPTMIFKSQHNFLVFQVADLEQKMTLLEPQLNATKASLATAEQDADQSRNDMEQLQQSLAMSQSELRALKVSIDIRWGRAWRVLYW